MYDYSFNFSEVRSANYSETLISVHGFYPLSLSRADEHELMTYIVYNQYILVQKCITSIRAQN